METAVALPAPAAADVLNRLRGCATWTALCAVVTYRDVSTAERRDGITSAVRTVLDCALKLPFDQALAVADSALRSGDVGRHELIQAATALRGPGSSRSDVQCPHDPATRVLTSR